MSYPFSLPTTGAVSFVDYVDSPSSYSAEIADATAQRARLRATLKEMKKETQSERDYQLLMNIIEEYLPYLVGLVNCIETKELTLKKDIETSWRSTLSDHIIHTGSNAPRITCKDIQYELIFVLMTYAYACALKANEILSNSNNHIGSSSDSNNHVNHTNAIDAETFNKATNLLNTAAGVFHTVANDVIPTWRSNGNSSGSSCIAKDSDTGSSSSNSSNSGNKPIETNREFAIALSKMTLADAQAVAINKALVTSNISKSLTAKLYMGVVDQYEMAFGLINSIHAQEVTTDLKRYLTDGTLYYKAMAKKYLAMDANHQQRMGQACGFARDAKVDLKSLQQHSITKAAAHKLKKLSSSGTTATTIAVAMKAAKEEEIVTELLSQYKMINDKVSYESVPSRQELQKLIPGGRNLLELKQFILPEPSFGPSVKKQEKAYLLEGRYF